MALKEQAEVLTMIDRTSQYVVPDEQVYPCWRSSNPGFSKADNNNNIDILMNS